MKNQCFNLPHNVPLSTKNAVTIGALEVSHVPVVTFGLGTFISKDDLKE